MPMTTPTPRDATRANRRRRTLLALVAASLTPWGMGVVGCGAHHNPNPSYPGARLLELSQITFDDGDTFSIDGKPVRLLGVDTPELAHPEMGWLEPQPYGPAAAESTRVWMTRAVRLEIVRDGWDRYLRRLAHVFVDGELLSLLLLRHALAYETVSHYGDNGFPDLAQMILDTARAAPRPPFEPPYKWKAKQRKKRERSGH